MRELSAREGVIKLAVKAAVQGKSYYYEAIHKSRVPASNPSAEDGDDDEQR